MARRTARQSNFPQLGSEGEYYHVKDVYGNPKYTEAGNPEMAWKFSDNPTWKDPVHRLSATATLVHSIERATPAEVEHGMNWYPKVQEATAKGVRRRGFLSGHSDKMLAGAGLVAAVSPNMDWDRANIGAMKELSTLKSEHWDTIMAARAGDSRAARRSQAAASDVVRGMEISSSPIRNLQKAGRIIRGENPELVIPYASAPKTHSFMHNIADPSNPHFVTVDGRAYDTLTNRMRPWEVNRGIGGSKTNKSPPGRYIASGDIFKAVAHSMGIHPSAAQAISWSHTKYGIEQAGGTRKQGPTRIGQPYFHPETGESAAFLPHLGGQFG